MAQNAHVVLTATDGCGNGGFSGGCAALWISKRVWAYIAESHLVDVSCYKHCSKYFFLS